MKCSKCGKECEEWSELSDYGRAMRGVKDTKRYCDPCFDEKYPPRVRKEDEESDD